MKLSLQENYTLEVNMKPIELVIKEGNEYLSSHSGLALIGALMEQTKLNERLNRTILSGCKDPKISNGDITKSMIGLLCLGKPDYEAIEPFRNDLFFSQSLGIAQCPSSSTLRQRMDVVDGCFDRIVKEETMSLIRRMAPDIGTVSTKKGELAPLDADVSPFDNSNTQKEGVSQTYKDKLQGFAPMFGYLGREGYLVNVEFREGKQHSQKNTPAFLRDAIRYSKLVTDIGLLVRLDSGNDSLDNIVICIDENTDWLIKRNLRRENIHEWLKLARETGKPEHSREGKTVWRGETYRKIEGFDNPLRIVYEVTERTINKNGQHLLIPEINVDTWWTSLEDDPYQVILLYHDHGTCEQFHSEIKTDMDLERLPSGCFVTNSDIMVMGLMAYNLLRLCGQESIREDNGNLKSRAAYRKKAKRRRLRTVMQDLIYMACRITVHARKKFISFGRYNPWAAVWENLYRRFMIPAS